MHSTRTLTTIGFTLMLILMLAMMGTSVVRLQAIHASLRAIVENHNVKMASVWDMRHAARERAMALHRLLQTDDPFEADELIRAFSNQAGRFIQARDILMSSALSRQEQQLLDQTLQLARVGQSVQQEAVDALQRGDMDRMAELLATEVIPAQNAVFAKLENLLNLQQVATRKAERQAQEAYQSALNMTILIGLVFLGVGIIVASYVIRRNSASEMALHNEKERAEITLHAIGEAVLCTDETGHVTYMNPVASVLSGYSLAEGLQLPLGKVLRVIEEKSGRPLFDHFAPGEGLSLEEELRTNGELVAKNGSHHYVELNANALHDPLGETIGAVLVIRDVTEDRVLAQQLSWAASHDALTGLINRREFERKLTALLEDARHAERDHALLYLDLDQFKVVNDTCGHAAGDELLKQLASLLQGQIRNSDTLARLGGDEFGVLLEGCRISKATAVAEQLRDAVEKFRFMWDDKPFDVGVSIGVAQITPNSENTNSLLSAVDAACYVAKDKGRNLVHVFEPDDQETSLRTGEMQRAQEVSQAIKEGRLTLFVQKIEPLLPDAAHQTHLELLVRMRDAQGQIIPPMAFIPAAERYGLMPALDRWVVSTILHRLAKRTDPKFFSLCAINLSGQTLGDRQSLEYILEQFRLTGVSPEQICFEITETAAIANLRSASEFIATLKTMGCRFALDDFGSGMSSFGYLRQLNVDFLKIDGAFVRDVLNDPTDRTMVAAINDIGHAMGLKTIAEFVENAETAALLKAMGVDYVQGYGIHRPEPLENLAVAANHAAARSG